MRIGIDIDGCLTDYQAWCTYSFPRYAEANGYYVKAKDLQAYYISDKFWAEKEECYEKFENEYFKKVCADFKVREFAPEVMSEIKNRGHKPFIVTGRTESVRQVTLEFLEKNKIVFEDIIFTDDKLQAYKDLNLKLHLDDSMYYLRQLNTPETNYVIFDQSHNRYLLGPRVNNWPDLLELIKIAEEKGLYHGS